MTDKLAKPAPDLTYETAAREKGFLRIAGVDEVGRGPLAGPVMAAAVVLDIANVPEGLNDSKKLSGKKRRALFGAITTTSQVGVGEASVEEIDEHNILRASHIAMVRAVESLDPAPDYLLIDGNMIPRGLNVPSEAVIKGDGKSQSIAAASIIAKTLRDDLMVALGAEFPGYGWEKNAGYPTKMHQDALKDLGVTPHHRRSFKPVHNILYQG
ncbi:ribonuclease HII [Halocynthiibacter namhaensis]|uniref:ribonuclease HII n=1 Tax=Halocynthiibacter namhaensis TaxID=1290553 RepID=UPI0005796B73|nr:ribonuclease HII [Halocynthiibacter namhaensis]